MTIEQTIGDNQKFYVNMDFSKLANDINNNTLQHSFNGKGRKVTYLEDNQEASYFYYSSDSAGKNKITPPFVTAKQSSNGKIFCKAVLLYNKSQKKVKQK